MKVSFRLGYFVASFLLLGLIACRVESQPAPRPTLRPLPVPANSKLPSVFLIGASDVRNSRGTGSDRGLWGWGEPLAKYFDAAKINVVNRAVGGLSNRTYQTMGYWEATLALMKPGDFLIIAFGPYPPSMINDSQRPHGTLAGIGEETAEIENVVTRQREVVHTFGWYTRKFIVEAKARGVTSILCTNTALKLWRDGKIVRAVVAPGAETWPSDIARTAGIGFLPLNEIIARRYEELGPAKVEAFFGRDDIVHTNADGADLNAQCVIAALRGLQPNPLEAYFSTKANGAQP